MLQTIDGTEVYVVDLKTVPKLPITWNTPEEEPYARALHEAIQTKQITEPGKYGIDVQHFHPVVKSLVYRIVRIIE